MSSGEGWDAVCPGLNGGADCLIRVGREGDPGTAEVQIVEFAIGIVTPERCAEGVILCIVECCASVC
ncbi:MAG TPA: hypothetical protein VMW63_06370, partial [Methanoregulaceae archaeon]|nr:hypothetical protein [Methanoregulaceae archaeon]